MLERSRGGSPEQPQREYPARIQGVKGGERLFDRVVGLGEEPVEKSQILKQMSLKEIIFNKDVDFPKVVQAAKDINALTVRFPDVEDPYAQEGELRRPKAVWLDHIRNAQKAEKPAGNASSQ